jgi:16S rRNA (guanine966-N2)-methyltransferase
MRITAGRLKGRPLAAPSDLAVRPTSDKVRQAVFNILEHGDLAPFALQGARVIDLFAGTGALGLEALSRGARYALFIDDAAGARAILWRNVEALGLTGAAKIWRRDATHLGPCSGEPYDLAFLDPPYRRNLVGPALAALAQGGWLRPGAVAVAELARGDDIPSPDEFALRDERLYGDTRVVFFQRTSD